MKTGVGIAISKVVIPNKMYLYDNLKKCESTFLSFFYSHM